MDDDAPKKTEQNIYRDETSLKVDASGKTAELTHRKESVVRPNAEREKAEADAIRMLSAAKTEGWRKFFDTVCYLVKEYGPYVGALVIAHWIKKSIK